MGPMNMVGRLLRSLSALVVLVAVVVGAPIALWVLGRGLLPAGVPSLSEFWQGLTSRDTGGVFLGLLVVVGFIAWAVFTGCVVLEIAALLVGRRRAWQIPMLRVPQSAATALISVILTGAVMLGGASAAIAHAPAHNLHQSLSVGTSATATATAVPGTAAALGQTATAPPATAATPVSAAGPVWTVARYDTFWGIAAETLGDGRRYQEIVALNVGVGQADGGAVQDSATNMEIGWQLRLPADATAPPTTPPVASVDQVTVQRGDTLSGIAQEQLGDATRYPELATLNGISNPDLINPGEVIRISDPAAILDPVAITPATAAPAPGVAESVGQNPAQSPAAAAPAESDGQNQPSAAGPAAAEEAAPTPPAPPTPGLGGQNGAPAQAPVPQEPAAATLAGSAESAAGEGEDRDHSAVAPAVVGIGVSAVLAAAVWLGLLAARRKKGRRRPTGKQPVMVSLQAARVEKRIRERASTSDVMWMDNALRYAATLSTGRDVADLPDVTCVWLSDTELQLQLAAPTQAPAPFTAEGDSWVLPVAAELPACGEEWVDPAAPFPLLTSIGDLDGETLLVDFERLGAVSVTGDANRTRDLLTHIAVELANNAWSDHLQVTLVGWGPELVALNPDRVRHVPTVSEVARFVRGRIGETRQAMADLQTTVLADRVVDQGAGDWSPEVWLIDAATAADDLHALEEVLAGIAATGRSTVAVIARGEGFAPVGGTVINVDADGILSLPAFLGEQRVRAAGMDPEALGRLLELFDSAGQFEQPGPMPGTDPWARGMNTAGSLLPEDLVIDPGHADVDVPVVSAEPGELDQEDEVVVDDQEVGQKSGQVLTLRAVPSAAAVAALEATLAADTDLDDDLAEWFDQVPRRPRVAVLGPPLVVANGVIPNGRPVRMTEIAIYLGTHREVDADKFVTDLWAEDATIKAVSRRSDISRVRGWLGVDENGRKYLPEARSKPYRMTRLLDLDLFRRLRKRADARAGVGDTVGEQRDLLSALILVRGPVMADASKDAYSWLVTSDPAGVLQAPLTVIATAHQLVNSALADDDLDLARLAADIGHRVDPAEDQPLCDLLRISHRAGNDLDARSWAQLLLQSNGVDAPEDLPNLDSYLTVHEVFPRGLRAAAVAASG